MLRDTLSSTTAQPLVARGFLLVVICSVAGLLVASDLRPPDAARKQLPLHAAPMAAPAVIPVSLPSALSAAIQQGDLAAAEAAFQEGNRYFARKDYRNAIASFSKALSADPSFHFAYIARGDAQLAAGEFDSAASDYSSAITANPFDAVPYFARGMLRWFTGDLDLAERDWRKAIQLQPDNAYYYQQLANLFYEQKRNDEVYSLYEQAYRSDTNRRWAAEGWLAALAAKEQYAELLRAARELQDRGLQTMPVRFYAGLALIALKRYSEAVTELEAAIALDPNAVYLDAYSYLASAYRSTGRTLDCKRAVSSYSQRLGRAVPPEWCDTGDSE